MKVGIIGAGTMGSGIAQAFAQTEGYEVFLCDINEEFAANGKKKIAKGFEKRIAKGKMTQEVADAVLAKITTGVKTICTDCDLVVEAALENMQIKKQTFKELQDICKADCIFATNTSSLSITEIGAGLDRPVIGMHFFNPAPVMKLVEVIAGLNTPEEVVEKIKAISVEIGKTPVQVNEAAGFVVNRILVPMINEAVGIYADGVASVEDIDTAMKLGCKPSHGTSGSGRPDRSGYRTGYHGSSGIRDWRSEVSSSSPSEKDGSRRTAWTEDRQGLLRLHEINNNRSEAAA